MPYAIHLQCPLCGHRYTVQSDQSRQCPECARAAGGMPSGLVVQPHTYGHEMEPSVGWRAWPAKR